MIAKYFVGNFWQIYQALCPYVTTKYADIEAILTLCKLPHKKQDMKF